MALTWCSWNSLFNDMAIPSLNIDATNQPLGRLASRIASMLMGKGMVGTKKHLVHKQKVVIRNCSKVRIDKRKLKAVLYYKTSGHPGGLKSEPMGTLYQKDPSAVVARTIAGMLPKNSLREKRLKNLELHNA